MALVGAKLAGATQSCFRNATKGTEGLGPEEIATCRAGAASVVFRRTFCSTQEAEIAAAALGATKLGAQTGLTHRFKVRAAVVAPKQLVGAETVELVDKAPRLVAFEATRIVGVTKLRGRAHVPGVVKLGAVVSALLDLSSVALFFTR